MEYADVSPGFARFVPTVQICSKGGEGDRQTLAQGLTHPYECSRTNVNTPPSPDHVHPDDPQHKRNHTLATRRRLVRTAVHTPTRAQGAPSRLRNSKMRPEYRARMWHHLHARVRLSQVPQRQQLTSDAPGSSPSSSPVGFRSVNDPSRPAGGGRGLAGA